MREESNPIFLDKQANGEIEPPTHDSSHVCLVNDENPFSEDDLISIFKVFTLLKNQRDKIAKNNLDTQVDTFELK